VSDAGEETIGRVAVSPLPHELRVGLFSKKSAPELDYYLTTKAAKSCETKNSIPQNAAVEKHIIRSDITRENKKRHPRCHW
jgi:hypothetical protein